MSELKGKVTAIMVNQTLTIDQRIAHILDTIVGVVKGMPLASVDDPTQHKFIPFHGETIGESCDPMFCRGCLVNEVIEATRNTIARDLKKSMEE